MKNVIKILTINVLILLTVMMSGCDDTQVSTSVESFFSDNDTVLVSSVNYASGFDIYRKDGISKLVMYNPDNTKKVFAEYYFMDKNKRLEFEDSDKIFTYPMDSFAVFSATQLNAFSKLGILDKVVAISESEYIQNKDVIKLMDDNRIINLASNGNFFLEKTLELNPEIVFYIQYYMTQKHPLAETQLTMIPFFDFKESDPLGRAEWIKFTALFFKKEALADSIFDSIVEKYNYYRNIAKNIKHRPTVFSDKYYSGQWFVPGGQSYISKLFHDAGVDYLWKDNSSKASFNLDFEVVFSKAHNADYWRIVGTYPGGFSYDILGSENELYKNFNAFKNRKVVFCDSRSTTYFETGTLEPHIILADLITAFHPEINIDHKPVYYKHYQ